ncbi:MAG: DUF2948 family protein [Alphaproteobacteria bacterium]|nr:DUF2948 family protein [Alphaproteobacteria bacterium]
MSERAKLRAEDAEDLAVISAYLQDAVLKVGDLAYLPHQRRFAFVCNRFKWEELPAADARGIYHRARAGVHFDGVLKVQSSAIRRDARDAVLDLLSIGFDAKEEGAGTITLTFAGGAAIRIEAECIDVVLEDIGEPWGTRVKPGHDPD